MKIKKLSIRILFRRTSELLRGFTLKVLNIAVVAIFVMPLLTIHISAYPHVLLSDIAADDDTIIISGEEFTLNYTLKNPYETVDLHNLFVAFEVSDGIYPGDGISNTQLVSSLKGWGTHEGSIKLRADKNLLGGIYPIKVNIEYEDAQGTTYKTAASVSVVVEQPINLQLGEVRFPVGFRTSDNLRIAIQYTNAGSSAIQDLQFLINGKIKSPPVQVSLGDVDSGYEGTSTLDLSPLDPDIAELELTVMYENSSGEQVIERVVPLAVDVPQGGVGETDLGEGTAGSGNGGLSDINHEDEAEPAFDVELFVAVLLLFAFISAIGIGHLLNKRRRQKSQKNTPDA